MAAYMGRRVSVDVHLDQRLINAMLFDASGASALRAARKVEARARANAPYDTGALSRSIVPRLVRKGVVTEYTVATGKDIDYAYVQEHGYPYRIYPRRAKVLRFKPKGSNVFIFRRSVRGAPATHYMKRAYDSLTFADFLP